MFLQIEKGKKKGRRGRGGDDAHSVSVLADFSVRRLRPGTSLKPPKHRYGVYGASCGVRLVVVEGCMKGSLRLT
ncbi:hypothetical protein CXB51_020391 [Gossypium anomalum]|uniref:Uncharacterized protein n=1 Tax=Gossypium anomalum TaxID=47600 RepID=A0A8J5YQJ1_9ROSI|nr:hypothetical protein CXB51_020391 [Gossypium anomalum]